MAAKNDYDIILNDIQMPIMSGFDATTAIREEGPVEKRYTPPIIAMIAHAMAGGKEKSLEGGMDDHITKPIDPNILFSTLKKWIKPGAREIPKYLAEKIASESKNNELESLPKSPGIDSVVGLSRIGGNEKLYRSLLVKFHDDYTDTTEQIKEALLKEDLELVTFLAHTIKGVAGNLGANDLQSVAGDIEHSANGATLEKINQQLTNFDENFSLFS